MLRRTAIKTLGLGALSLALPVPMLAKKATPGPRIIWHRNRAFVPRGFGDGAVCRTMYSGDDLATIGQWQSGWDYWAEVYGAGKWASPKARRRGEPIPDDDYFGTWIFSVMTYDADKRDYSADPYIAAISGFYRVPFRAWAGGQDMTVEPNLSDPAWQVRVSMAHLLFRTPKTYLDQPYPL